MGSESPPASRDSLTGSIFKDEFILFTLAFIVNFITAFWLGFVAEIGNNDALARAANAYYTLYSRDPHLAAVGFVWPPLPSFLQIPLLPLTKTLGIAEHTGALITCVLGAATLVVINRLLAFTGIACAPRWLLLACVQFSPGFWYLTASGMSEPVLLFFLLLAVLGFQQIFSSTGNAVMMGLSLAMAVFTRYETVGMMTSAAAAIVIRNRIETERRVLQGLLLAVFTPPMYAFGLWALWNWMITGDPLYFFRSSYSLASAWDVAKNVGESHPLYKAIGNPFETVTYAGLRLSQHNVAFPVVLAIGTFVAAWRRDLNLASQIVLMMGIPALTASQVFMGTLPPYFRYWFYATPFAAILIGLLQYRLSGMTRKLFILLSCCLMVAAIPLAFHFHRDNTAAIDEQRIGAFLFSPNDSESLRRMDDNLAVRKDSAIIAREIDARSTEGLVMVDSQKGFAVIMASQYPERLAINSDQDFTTLLEQPHGKVAYILVITPEISRGGDLISQKFPNLFDNGLSWAKLELDFKDTGQHWRLYRVIDPSTVD